jgi:hypothetical protein
VGKWASGQLSQGEWAIAADINRRRHQLSDMTQWAQGKWAQGKWAIIADINRRRHQPPDMLQWAQGKWAQGKLPWSKTGTAA